MWPALLCFSDGLVDCVDPDCCQQQGCESGPLCQGAPDPLDLVQHSPTPFVPRAARQFFEHVRFLVGRGSTHILPGEVPYDTR